jgi:hypothetical protein
VARNPPTQPSSSPCKRCRSRSLSGGSSQAGQWWALRGGPVRLDGPESLLLRCITAAELTGLAEKLCLQERLDRLDPQELAAVYDGKTLPRASRVNIRRWTDPGS